MTLSKTGLALAGLYFSLAIWVVQEELRHGGGGWISLRGMITGIITSPSQATLGVVLSSLGVPKVNFDHPGISGYAQLAAHVLLTALLIYGIGFGLGWIAGRFMPVANAG